MQKMMKLARRLPGRAGRRSALWSAVVAATSLLGSSVHAQTAVTGVAHDTRCLLAMGVLANNPKNRPPALLGVYYYAGRIAAADPRFDFSTGLKKAAAGMAVADYDTAARACAAELGRQIQALNAAQATLASPPPAPTTN